MRQGLVLLLGGELCLLGRSFQNLENETLARRATGKVCENDGCFQKWNSRDAVAGIQGEVAAMMQGGFRLVGAAALLYISNVYWEAPRIQAKETTETIHGLLSSLNYGKSSKYQLATAAMTLARNMTKKYGQPDAAKERNVVWGMLQDAATFSEAVDLVVASIKADYAVNTMADLYAALSGNKLTKAKDEATLEQTVVKAIEKAGATSPEIGALAGKIATLVPEAPMAAMAAIVGALSLDELNAVAEMVALRMMELAAPAEDKKAA